MDNNTSYETQAIDINLLSVLDITKDGKVVSAEKWVELWNLVFQHINKIDAFCVDIQSTLDNWHESEIALNEIIEDMQMKYDALSTEFIHYGENTPENPHIMLWVRRMNDISTHGFLTNEDIDSALSGTSENPVQNKVVNAALNNKMDKNNPTGTGSFSLNRRSDTVVGDYSFAEGSNGRATGTASHVEGSNTEASGSNSHAEGSNTKASSDYQHVQGKYNIPDSNNIYADIIGNGSSDTERSNAHTLDWSGNAWYAGDVYVGSTSGTNKDDGSKKLATEEYANTQITEKTDQTYSPTSENAQSGKAVAEAIENKQNKLTAGANITIDENNVISATSSSGGGGAVSSRVPKKVAEPGAPFPSVIATSNGGYDEYGIPTDDSYMCINTVGAELGKDVNSNSAFIDSIPRRDSKGNLFTGTPVDDEDCANKKYVDNAIASSGGGSITVDQTYDENSQNAQSGKAVAEAAGGRIPKKIGEPSAPFISVVAINNGVYDENLMPTDDSYISVKSIGSTEFGKDVDNNIGNFADSIPRRDSNGNLFSGTPVDNEDCANKKYVDDKISAIPSGGGAVDDVQINGNSIVNGGIANIPIAASRKLGVISVGAGLSINNLGKLFVSKAENGSIDSRNDSYSPIVPSNIDYAVKAAMCDGKGAEWTGEEKTAARTRMGLGDYELIEEFDLPEEVNTITRTLEHDGTPYNFKSMAILIYVPAHTNADAKFSFKGTYSDLVHSTVWSNVIRTTETYSSLVLKNIGTNLFELYKGSGNQWEYPDSTVALRHNKYSNSQGDEITGFVFGVNNSANTLPAGTNIKIYGVRQL